MTSAPPPKTPLAVLLQRFAGAGGPARPWLMLGVVLLALGAMAARGRWRGPVVMQGALANPGGESFSAQERQWLKNAQMAEEMRRGLGLSLAGPPQSAFFASLHAHLGGECAAPAPAQDPLSALRLMRCQHQGKPLPRVSEGGPLSQGAAAELSLYFQTRLKLANCPPQRCFAEVTAALEKLKSGYTKEDLAARWLARVGNAPPEQVGPVLGALLNGRTPDRPRPELARVIDRLATLPPMPPKAALGLLRYAEKQVNASVGLQAARLGQKLNDANLVNEARSYLTVYAPGDDETELALRALAQGGEASRAWFSKALFRRCRGMIFGKRFSDAIACFKVVAAQNVPAERDLALWFQGKAAFLAGNPQQAHMLWQPLWQTGSDEVGGEAAFWMGEFYVNKGQSDQAQALARVAEQRFATSTHTGELLALLTRQHPGPARLANLVQRSPQALGVAGVVEKYGGAGPAPWAQLPAFIPHTSAGRSAMLLLLAGEPAAAAALVQFEESGERTTDWRPEHRLLLAWAQAGWRDYLASVKTVELLWWKTGDNALARTGLFKALLYPLYYLPQAKAASAEMGVGTAYLYGIMRQESRFMHRIRSRSGAIGLSQIMPSTGVAIAGWLGEGAGFAPEQLDDPGKNLRYGARYLAYLKEKFGPDNRLMAAGYNGGPGNVGRWLDKSGYQNPWGWVQAIPLEETRDYVKKVVHNAWMYDHLYPQLGCAEGLCRINWR